MAEGLSLTNINAKGRIDLIVGLFDPAALENLKYQGSRCRVLRRFVLSPSPFSLKPNTAEEAPYRQHQDQQRSKAELRTRHCSEHEGVEEEHEK